MIKYDEFIFELYKDNNDNNGVLWYHHIFNFESHRHWPDILVLVVVVVVEVEVEVEVVVVVVVVVAVVVVVVVSLYILLCKFNWEGIMIVKHNDVLTLM